MAKKYREREYSNERIDKLYNSYIKRANALNTKLFKEGAKTFQTMNKTEFEQKYIRLDRENKQLVSAGGTRDKNIVRTIINNQAYQYSPEIARAIKKEQGLKNVKMSQLRTGNFVINIDGEDILLTNMDVKQRNNILYNYTKKVNNGDYTPWGITETGAKGVSLFMTQVLYGSP